MQAWEAAARFACAVDSLTCDPRWLTSQLEASAAGDEFLKRLLRIAARVYGEDATSGCVRRITEDVRLHLLRSDFMLDPPGAAAASVARPEAAAAPSLDDFALQCVEVNTIAASFGGLSQQLREVHAALLRLCYPDSPEGIFECQGPEGVSNCGSFSLPLNGALDGMAKALAAAHRLYAERRRERQALRGEGEGGERAAAAPRCLQLERPLVLLLVSLDEESNAFDQTLLLERMQRESGALAVRVTLAEMRTAWKEGRLFLKTSSGEALTRGALRQEAASLRRGQLFYKTSARSCRQDGARAAAACLCGAFEVSLLLFRCMYAPEHFQVPDAALLGESDEMWQLREVLEASDAVKVPTVLAQLAGMKKIQQVLSTASLPASRCSEDAAVEALREEGRAALQRLLPREEDWQSLARVLSFQVDPLDAMASVDEDGLRPASRARGDEALRLSMQALRFPGKFVLKPQREGGGHVVHGREMQRLLEGHVRFLKAKERSSCRSDKEGRGTDGEDGEDGALLRGFVLSRRFQPPVLRAVLVRPFQSAAAETLREEDKETHRRISLDVVPCVGELGVFSVYLSPGGGGPSRHSEEFPLEKGVACGWLLRTKPASSVEGGVAAGFGCLDSPFLLRGNRCTATALSLLKA